MKKLVSIFLIFNLLLCPLFAETIKIETSKGKTDLVIPETQEELREAFIEMSKLYIEERYAYEDLIETSKKLTQETKQYINDNEILRNQYTKLSEDYNELIDTMNKRNRVKPIKGIVGVELGFENLQTEMNMMPAVELGAYIFEKVIVKTRISYPWELGLGVEFTF